MKEASSRKEIEEVEEKVYPTYRGQHTTYILEQLSLGEKPREIAEEINACALDESIIRS